MTPRKRLATLGKRGALIRLFLETRKDGKGLPVKRYVVQYGTRREQESFPFTPAGKLEAEAFLKAYDAEQQTPAERVPLTHRDLWTAYLAAEAEHLRPNTRRLYGDAWRSWEQHVNPRDVAQDTTIGQIHEFRGQLDRAGKATATVKGTIRAVRIVFNWGERMELIDRNRWHLFVHKVAKEKRTKPRAEYRADEFLAIWKALDPTNAGQWRAWVAVGLLGIYGNRQNELLNLQWSWIVGDVVEIPAEYVKTGEDHRLTLFPLTRGLLDVAQQWAGHDGYTGAYVLYPGQLAKQKKGTNANPTKLPHYSIQSLTDAIHRAERRSGVETIEWRAGHGFRRGLVGDLAEQTGDVQFALQAIGDKDVRMAEHYRARRDDRVSAAVQERAERLTGASE